MNNIYYLCRKIGVWAEIHTEADYLRKLFAKNISNIFKIESEYLHLFSYVDVQFGGYDHVTITLNIDNTGFIKKVIYLTNEVNDNDDLEFSEYSINLAGVCTINKFNQIKECYDIFGKLLKEKENIELIFNYCKAYNKILDNTTEHIKAYDKYYEEYSNSNSNISNEELERNIKLDVMCQTIINN